jgi:predicted acetyltransferase
MTSQLEYGTLTNSDDAKRLGQILCQCFNGPSSDWQYYSNQIGLENFRCIRRGSEILGGLAILQIGQWFGSQCIPMAAIASVGVPPEHRGTGVAAKLLSLTLKELHKNGVSLSTLYAATQGPYRKVGYEQAGTCCFWELPLDSIGLRVGNASLNEIRNLPIRSVPNQPEIFHDLYQQSVIKNNGNLERCKRMWALVFQPQNEAFYAYMVGSETQPEGYVIFNQRTEDGHYNLAIRDWVALTPAAGRRLWTFLADHRSIAQKVMWRGPALDSLLLLLPEQTEHISRLERWLLRVVDVPKALEKRGYPVGVEAQLHLEVWDDLLVENNGRFVLTVSGGRGEVTRGGRGELQLDVRALAPLYTGLFTPHQLQLTAQIEASDAALSVAAQLFSGSEPWMSDKF